MTNDPGAGAYKVPLPLASYDLQERGREYFNERAMLRSRRAFVLIAQMRSWLPDAVGGILWFGVDDANTAVLTPMSRLHPPRSPKLPPWQREHDGVQLDVCLLDPQLGS